MDVRRLWYGFAVAALVAGLVGLYQVAEIAMQASRERTAVLSVELGALVSAIAYLYVLTLWNLIASRSRPFLAIGTVLIAAALAPWTDHPLKLVLSTCGALLMASSIVGVAMKAPEIALPRIEIRLRPIVVAILVAIAVTTAMTTLFTVFRPPLPVFIGREAILPSGEIESVEKVLRAYVETAKGRALLTDYGTIPVKSIVEADRGVHIDTPLGSIDIAKNFFDQIREVGTELAKKLTLEIPRVEVNWLSLSIAKLYALLHSILENLRSILIPVLKLIYGLLILLIGAVMKSG